MTVATIPSLSWKSTNGFQRFEAQINEKEYFVADFDAERAEGYQWALSIAHRHMVQKVLLHSHATLQEAKQAAARHIGDE